MTDSTKFRADHVGSLLRPPALLAARRCHEAGEISAGELRAVEDEAIAAAVRTQEEAGIDVVCDETFALALAEFGEQGLVDIIGSLGNYSMLAMLLNTFQVDLQAVEPPFPDVRGYAKVAASLGG
jgi:predicted NUDIX family NTP pyrophosphohydrolase